MGRHDRAWLIVVMTCCGAGCSSEAPGDEPDPDDVVTPEGCAEGELSLGDSCFFPGTAPSLCAEGFEAVDSTCRAIVPQSCPPGQMARLGMTTCQEVGLGCGAGPWGDIPTDADTIHVDGSFTGGFEDGSAQRPYPTIGEAVSVAPPGALIAIAEGRYEESVGLGAKPVQLWGRCPQLVEIAPVSGPAVEVTTFGSGSGLHNLALVGASEPAAKILNATDVQVSHLWVHDTAGRGIEVEGAGSPAGVTIADTLVERAFQLGVHGEGATVVLRDSEVREIAADDQGRGFGVAVFPNIAFARSPIAELERVVVRDVREIGVNLIGAQASMRASVVQRVGHDAGHDWGIPVSIQLAVGTWERATVTISQSELGPGEKAGLLVIASDVLVEATSIHDITVGGFGDLGRGVEVEDHAENGLTEVAEVTLTDSAIQRVIDSGLMNFGSKVTFERSLVRDVAHPGAAEPRGGTGAWAQPGFIDDTLSATMTVSQTLFERASHAGVGAFFSDLFVERTLVRDIAANPNGTFGDGIIVAGPNQLEVSSSYVEAAARVGIADFGGEMTLTGSELVCNAIQLSATPLGEHSPTVHNGGDNLCRCNGEETPCKAASPMLEPPSPVDK